LDAGGGGRRRGDNQITMPIHWKEEIEMELDNAIQ